MKICFNINYLTQWGEDLFISGDLPELQGTDSRGVKMQTDGSGHWWLTTEIQPSQGHFEYSYKVCRTDGSTRLEWGTPHKADIDPRAQNVKIFDSWNDTPNNKAAYSTAYIECINPHKPTRELMPSKAEHATFGVEAPFVPSDMVLAVCGNCESLGLWNPTKALILDCVDFPHWRFSLPLSVCASQIEYKYLLLRKDTLEEVAWEPRSNRTLDLTGIEINDTVIINHDKVDNPLQRIVVPAPQFRYFHYALKMTSAWVIFMTSN